MSYSVVILRRAQKELAGLPSDMYNRVCDALRLVYVTSHDPLDAPS